VNFFGHAVAASWVEASPAFAYGAMLPDLLLMVGARRFECDDAEVRRGADFHHLTDRCFHNDPTFSELESNARRELLDLGVRKGPRRALSHVGIELVLDAVLARSPATLAAYQRALVYSEQGTVRALPGGDTTRLAALSRILRERSARLVPRDAVEMTERMARVLERRPALSFDDSEASAVMHWTRAVMTRVDGIADGWIAELRETVTNEFTRYRLRLPGSSISAIG
jgi:hypothetical protein